jgi:TonB family protein
MRYFAAAAVLVFCACATDKGSQRTTADPEREERETARQMAAITPEQHDAIERLFARKAAALHRCWSDEYERNRDRKVEGDVTVQLHIKPDGRPSGVRVLKSSINNENIEKCVISTVTEWDFPSGNAEVPYVRTVHLGAQF